MTTYFDTFDNRLRDIAACHAAGVCVSEELGAMETELVRDVSVAAMVPGFPDALRSLIHRAVLRWSYFTRARELPEIDFDDDIVWIRRLRGMSDALHGIFHEVGRSGVDGFGDSPLRAIQTLADRAEDERLAMFAADPSLAPARPHVPGNTAP